MWNCKARNTREQLPYKDPKGQEVTDPGIREEKFCILRQWGQRTPRK